MIVNKITRLTRFTPDWYKFALDRFGDESSVFEEFSIPSNKVVTYNSELNFNTVKDPTFFGATASDNKGVGNLGLSRKSGTSSTAYIYDGAFNALATGNNAAAHFSTASNDSIASDVADVFMSLLDNGAKYTYINGEFIREASNIDNFLRVVKQISIKFYAIVANANRYIGWWANGIYNPNPYFNGGNDRWANDYGQNPVEANTFYAAEPFKYYSINNPRAYTSDRLLGAEEFYTYFQAYEGARYIDNKFPLLTNIKRLTLPSFWEQAEHLENPNISLDYLVAGVKKTSASRTPKTPQFCRNFGLTACSTLGGYDHWGTPYIYEDDLQYFYALDEYEGHNNYNLSSRVGHYPFEQSLQKINLTLGKWYCSQEAKSIIETSDYWEIPDFKYNGNLIDGKYKLPSFSRNQTGLVNGLPIVRLIFNSNKTEALAYVFYPLNPNPTDDYEVTIIHPELNEVTVTVRGTEAELILLN